MRKCKHEKRAFTAEEDAIFEEAKAQDDAELDQLKAEAKAMMSELQAIEDVVAVLRAARIAKGMSLADIDAVTGMGRSNISRLENQPGSNPTLSTLMAYAKAVGVKLQIAATVEDAA